MKRYGNLYAKMWDMKNIREAHKNAQRGKRHYREVQMVNADSEKYLMQIQAMLRDKTFRNSEYEVFTKSESGKEREIYKLPYFPDRIIHHCVMQVLEPIWMRTFITDTYSSLKGRGIHKGVERMKLALRDREKTQYCLKFDVRKYYPSIDHGILKSIIRRKIKDPDVLWLLDEVIDSTKGGVPIGNYLSQYFGNLYMAYFDHWMKEVHQFVGWKESEIHYGGTHGYKRHSTHCFLLARRQAHVPVQRHIEGGDRSANRQNPHTV